MGIYYNADEQIFINSNLPEQILKQNNYYPLTLIKLEIQISDKRQENFWIMESNGCEIISKYYVSGVSDQFVRTVKKTRVKTQKEIATYFDYVRNIGEKQWEHISQGKTQDGYITDSNRHLSSYEKGIHIPLFEFIEFPNFDEFNKNKKSEKEINLDINIGAFSCSSYGFATYYHPERRECFFYPFISNVFIISNDYKYHYQTYDAYQKEFLSEQIKRHTCGSCYILKNYYKTFSYFDIHDIPKEAVDLENVKATANLQKSIKSYFENFLYENPDEIKALKEKIFEDVKKLLLLEIKDRDDKLQEEIIVRDNKVTEFRETVEKLLQRMDSLASDSRFTNLKEDFFKEIGVITQKTFLEFKKTLEQTIRDIDNKRQETILLSTQLDSKVNETKKKIESERLKIEKFVKTILNEASSSLDRLEKKKLQLIKDITEEVVKEVIKKNPVREIHINLGDDYLKRKVKGIYHEAFKEVLQLVHLNTPVFLVGPAGCGKNVMLKQVAKVLDLQFYYINDAREKYDLLGFVDANGKYQETQFFKAFTKGGLLMIDELDSADPSVLLLLNSALGTGDDFYMTFPNGNQYQAHPNFHIVAAANTFGTGANQTYNGRNQLDGASLNRFLPVEVDYDKNIEKALVNNGDILSLYWEVRRIIRENEINYVVSTRNILNADKYISAKVFSIDKIFQWTLIGSMTEFDLGVIISNINTSDRYSDAFKDFVKRNYNIQEANEKSRTKTRTRDDEYGYGRGNGYGYHGGYDY